MSKKSIFSSGESLEAVIESERENEYVKKPISFRRRFRRWMWHIIARQFALLSICAYVIAGWIGRRRCTNNNLTYEIMLTGRFDSDNWILAHLGPLSASKKCSRIWMVSTNPVPELPKVVAIYPPKLLIKVVGATPARLLIFLWAAMRKRPHIVGGFHLTVNGIMAAIIGHLAGARSIYFCVGGPPEVRDGGIHADDHAFVKMETADLVVETRLLRILSKFDIIITMGTRAVKFFRDKGVDTNYYVVSGGIDPKRFYPAEGIPSIDIILTGRLANIKRIDIFLQAIKQAVEKLPEVKAVIVGDGPLRAELHQIAKEFGIDRNVNFVGHQDNIERWLRKSKIFVLTSDSEGLSLSMMEAMMCGLPAVVSDVGDLGDLVENGVNGYLVPRRSPEQFAARIIELLTDARKLKTLSKAAYSSALRYTLEAATAKWENIIEQFQTS